MSYIILNGEFITNILRLNCNKPGEFEIEYIDDKTNTIKVIKSMTPTLNFKIDITGNDFGKPLDRILH